MPKIDGLYLIQIYMYWQTSLFNDVYSKEWHFLDSTFHIWNIEDKMLALKKIKIILTLIYWFATHNFPKHVIFIDS